MGTPLASDDDGEPLSDPCDRHTQLRDQADLAYARDLGTPGLGDTVDVVQTKAKYYRFHPDLNPTRIVPAGPVVSGWLEPHDRQRFGGSPCGDGAPPGPPPPEEIVAADHTLWWSCRRDHRHAAPLPGEPDHRRARTRRARGAGSAGCLHHLGRAAIDVSGPRALRAPGLRYIIP